jgi:hypothetical protein
MPFYLSPVNDSDEIIGFKKKKKHENQPTWFLFVYLSMKIQAGFPLLTQRSQVGGKDLEKRGFRPQ